MALGFLSDELTEAHLYEMNMSQSHRGPDNSGYFFSDPNRIGLTHNRLSIIDLSSTANQPYESSCGRYSMVYNGEVYNYGEIRAELPNKIWKTKGDTEVIIEAFATWGAEFIHKLNGMFALAIWDKKNKSVFIARDRIGIKPLFIYQKDGNFAFSSELKALKKIYGKTLNINSTSIAQFLHYGYIPGPNTIFQHITKFPTGTYAIIKDKSINYTKYWNPEDTIESSVSSDFNENKKVLHSLLSDSVRKRLISDVPVGTFLSGGIDSSLITAIAQKNSTTKVKSFSIGFKEAKFNESHHAANVAKHIGTDHHEFILSEQEAIEQLDNLLDIYDEPYADSSAIPTLLVSQQTKKHVSVALSGDGGDELFWGTECITGQKDLLTQFFITLENLYNLLQKTSNKRLLRGSELFNYLARA